MMAYSSEDIIMSKLVVYKCKKIQISIKWITNQDVIDLDEYNHFKLIDFEEMFGR
jgi:hypothetical protein